MFGTSPGSRWWTPFELLYNNVDAVSQDSTADRQSRVQHVEATEKDNLILSIGAIMARSKPKNINRPVHLEHGMGEEQPFKHKCRGKLVTACRAVQVRIIELQDHLLSTYDRQISIYTNQQFARYCPSWLCPGRRWLAVKEWNAMRYIKARHIEVAYSTLRCSPSALCCIDVLQTV